MREATITLVATIRFIWREDLLTACAAHDALGSSRPHIRG